MTARAWYNCPIRREQISDLRICEDIIPYEANQLAMQICAYYAGRFQIVYSVHEDTDNLHIHFVLNTVSYVDGKKFTESPAELWRFKEYVGKLINRYIH